jgi:hypothetical protein
LYRSQDFAPIAAFAAFLLQVAASQKQIHIQPHEDPKVSLIFPCNPAGMVPGYRGLLEYPVEAGLKCYVRQGKGIDTAPRK